MKSKLLLAACFLLCVSSCDINKISNGQSLINTSSKSEMVKVTFDAMNGRFADNKRYQSLEFKKYAKVKEPDAPNYVGHDFIGWFTENKLWVSKYDFNERVTENFTLYAKYKELNAYKVTFDANGGLFYFGGKENSYNITTVYEGKKVSPPQENPFKQGYTFLGWTLENDTNLFDFNNAINSDLTLYAKYE